MTYKTLQRRAFSSFQCVRFCEKNGSNNCVIFKLSRTNFQILFIVFIQPSKIAFAPTKNCIFGHQKEDKNGSALKMQKTAKILFQFNSFFNCRHNCLLIFFAIIGLKFNSIFENQFHQFSERCFG